MKLQMYQVDAFAEEVFTGNPAAVCILPSWLPDPTMQSIAAENNLSETAFVVPAGEAYELRWFTPVDEVNLCGHATLATAHVLFDHCGVVSGHIRFKTKSGELRVVRTERKLSMDFPSDISQKIDSPNALLSGLSDNVVEVLAATDVMAVFSSEEEITAIDPDFKELEKLKYRGVIATAPGRNHDFVSRCFYPRLGVNEDPVTGSAHCQLAPYWSRRLGRKILFAKQLSHRGGLVECEYRGERVILSGSAVTFMKAEIELKEKSNKAIEADT